MKLATFFLLILVMAKCHGGEDVKKPKDGLPYTVNDTVRPSSNSLARSADTEKVLPFKLIRGYPRIKDTLAFIKELRQSCKLHDDADLHSPSNQGRITYYKSIKINGSNSNFILLEYNYGDGCMAEYPWKYQFLFKPDGQMVKVLHGVRFELLKVFPGESPHLLILTATGKGNGGHELYRFNHGKLENIYEGYYNYDIHTYDAHDDGAVFEPNELRLLIKDANGDGMNDMIFTGKIVQTHGKTPDGIWYDCLTIDDKTTCYSLKHPYRKAPVEFVFLYNKESGHFRAKENYDEKYKEYYD